MFRFDKIPPDQFALLSTLVGIWIAVELDVNEQNAMGNFLVSVGQTMLTIAAQSVNQTAQTSSNQSDNLCKQIDQINSQLNHLKENLQNR